jgi:hypothetical protein
MKNITLSKHFQNHIEKSKKIAQSLPMANIYIYQLSSIEYLYFYLLASCISCCIIIHMTKTISSEIHSSFHTQSKFFYVPNFPQIRIQFTGAAIFISMGDGSVPIIQEHIVCHISLLTSGDQNISSTSYLIVFVIWIIIQHEIQLASR